MKSNLEYDVNYEIWTECREVFAGKRAMKLVAGESGVAGTKYLPMTSGQAKDYSGGEDTNKTYAKKLYDAYLAGASTQSFFKTYIETVVSLMAKEPPVFNTPPSFEYMQNSISDLGEPINTLLKDINTEQHLVSRCGLLLDLDSTTDEFYITFYNAESIVNYREIGRRKELEFVVLDESYVNEDDEIQYKYRVAGIKNVELNENDEIITIPVYFQHIIDNESEFSEFIYDKYEPDPDEYIVYKGKTYSELPFQFINASTLKPQVEIPLNLKLVDLDELYWQAYANYNLLQLGQNAGTFFLSGVTVDEAKNFRSGVSALNHSTAEGSKLTMIAPPASNIEASRQQLVDIKADAQDYGIGELGKTAGESGEHQKLAVQLKTIKLVDVAITAGTGIIKLLKNISRWVGIPEDEWELLPNLEFIDIGIDSTLVKTLMEMKALGLPISYESIHAYLQKNNITNKTLEQEIKEIGTEEQLTESETNLNNNSLTTGEQNAEI